MIGQFNAWFGYALEYAWISGKNGGVYDVGGYQNQDQPHVSSNEGGGHSLSQIWIVNTHVNSTVEFGWVVGLNGSIQPQLFVDHEDGGHYCANGCYNVGFTPYDGGLAMPLTCCDGAQHVYDIIWSSPYWWFYYDGHYLGYMPNTVWNTRIGTVNLTEAGGEVASVNTNASCSQMGTGFFVDASSGYSLWSTVSVGLLQNGTDYHRFYMNANPIVTDAGAWRYGNANPQGGFGFGGPGYVKPGAC